MQDLKSGRNKDKRTGFHANKALQQIAALRFCSNANALGSAGFHRSSVIIPLVMKQTLSSSEPAQKSAPTFHQRIARGAVVLLIAAVYVVNTAAEEVDQQNWNLQPLSFWVNVQQEFVPRLDSLDSVQLFMAANRVALGWPGGASFVNIRQGGADGPIIAASLPTYAPPLYDGPVDFAFATPVPLVPGQRYALEPVAKLRPIVPFAGTLPLYTDGGLLANGQFVGYDLIFREGIGLEPVPEPSPLLLLAAALGLALSAIAVGQRPTGLPEPVLIEPKP